jgi:hypothetical protein
MEQAPQARQPIAKPMPSATVFSMQRTAKRRSPVTSALKTAVPVVVVLLAVAGAGFVYFHAPYAAFSGLCKALGRHDAAALPKYVDFGLLRDSVGAVVAEAARAQQKGAEGQSREAALMAELGLGLMVAPLVDVIVSPAGLAAVSKGDMPDLLAADSSDRSSDSRPVKRSMRHEQGGRFVVSCCREGAPSAATRELVFQRTGILSWKLVGIR